MLDKDVFFMKVALSEARKAYSLAEVPVGAVVVRDGIIISAGHNLREHTQSALAHAELCALDAACVKLRSWRLLDCVLYVTLEPCMMCIGAAINARMASIVFGCSSQESRSANITEIDIKGGVLGNECSFLLSHFFLKCR
ncbi:MAG: nucleoside deaminase [Oscillospiraceae bacterium]|jgi:tRNA(adenine34) deaminase|nr:nucleoside deaminase [Oscillospiraceae bacterium]